MWGSCRSAVAAITCNHSANAEHLVPRALPGPLVHVQKESFRTPTLNKQTRVEPAKVRVAENCAQSFMSRGELQHHPAKVAENSHETKPELHDVLGYLTTRVAEKLGLPPHEVRTHDGSEREAHTFFALQILAKHSLTAKDDSAQITATIHQQASRS